MWHSHARFIVVFQVDTHTHTSTGAISCIHARAYTLTHRNTHANAYQSHLDASARVFVCFDRAGEPGVPGGGAMVALRTMGGRMPLLVDMHMNPTRESFDKLWFIMTTYKNAINIK